MAKGIAVGDFDRNGHVDLAVAATGDHTVAILSSMTGTFAAPRAFAVGDAPLSIATGDFDHDGLIDVAVTVPFGIAVLHGDGAGNLGSPRAYAVPGHPERIAAGDVDRDGNDDVVVTSVSANSVSVVFGPL